MSSATVSALALLAGLLPLGEPSVGDPAVPERRAPSGGETFLLRERGWPAGSIQDQLDRDPTLVPFGKGAVFVPAMTNGLDEPTVAVLAGRELIAEGTTGQRIVLAPGTYEVRLGSGAEPIRTKVQATVREGQTVVLPAAWSGLQVHVVDEQFGSLRGSYELIRVEDREYVGVGFGTDEQAGEPVTTWIVPPGLYKIVRVGENYRARRDFSTVRLVEGRLTHFVLVLDKDTFDFKGGGEVPEAEVFKPSGGFWGSLVLGADGSMNARSHAPGLPEGVSFTVRAFADGRLSAEIAGNPLLFRLQIEEGQTKNPDIPWQNSTDRAKLDGLYVYQLAPWIGPYVRVGGETNLLPSDKFFGKEKTITWLDPNCPDGQCSRVGTEVHLSPGFGNTNLKEGAGLNLRVLKTIFAETTLRTGLGGRHRIARDLLTAVSDGDTAATFERAASNDLVGFEATVLASARLTRFVILNLELDSLLPFDDPSNVVLDLDGSVALKLTSYVSVNYRLRFLRDRSLSKLDSLQQDVLLRFSLELL